MARRRRPPSSTNPRSTDLVRVTRAENAAIGEKPSSKRWKLRGEIITNKSQTYSDRFHHNLQLSERAGRKVTKEALKKGAVRYASAKEQEKVKAAKDARFIRSFVGEMTDADMKVALKWYRVQYPGLDDREKERFRNLFKRYRPDDIRQAFGSVPH
jgi:hypothetical protein